MRSSATGADAAHGIGITAGGDGVSASLVTCLALAVSVWSYVNTQQGLHE